MGKKKKGKDKDKKKKKDDAPPVKKDPMAPDYVPPVPKPGERVGGIGIDTDHIA